MNRSDLKRAALILVWFGTALIFIAVVEAVVRGLDRSPGVVLAVVVGIPGAWLTFQYLRYRKQPPDALRMKYGRINLAGFATSLVIRELVEVAASPDVGRIVALAVLAAWIIVVDFLYRKEQERGEGPGTERRGTPEPRPRTGRGSEHTPVAPSA